MYILFSSGTTGKPKCIVHGAGGSLIQHGGQNPLESARLGCKVIHGPNINNFLEVYSLLSKNNISSKIRTILFFVAISLTL